MSLKKNENSQFEKKAIWKRDENSNSIYQAHRLINFLFSNRE